MIDGKLQVGLIGLGNIACDRHLPAWNHVSQLEVAALADTSEDALLKAAAKCPDALRFKDWRDLLKVPNLDIVDICTPAVWHAPMALAALNHGHHVLCEKPLATSSKQIDTLADAVQRSGKLLMTAQVLRFLPVSRRAYMTIQEGKLGSIYYSRAQWLRRRRLPPNSTFIRRELSGGGPLLDIGVHVLDLACWFMGFPEPVSATAITGAKLAKREDVGSEWGEWTRKDFDVEDFAAGFVRFADGSALALEASWLAFQSEDELMRVQCFGTETGLDWPVGTLTGETNRKPWTKTMEFGDERSGFDEQMLQFTNAVRNNLSSPVPIEQTRQVTRILEGLYRSAELTREVQL